MIENKFAETERDDSSGKRALIDPFDGGVFPVNIRSGWLNGVARNECSDRRNSIHAGRRSKRCVASDIANLVAIQRLHVVGCDQDGPAVVPVAAHGGGGRGGTSAIVNDRIAEIGRASG